MSGLLEGKSVLVTGGGGGIGRATALTMAREGAHMVISDRSAEAGKETVRLIHETRGRAIFVAADVRSADEVKAMIEAAVTEFGRLDCAVNNAGITSYHAGCAGQMTGEVSEESWDTIIGINLTGLWYCMKHELDQMSKQGGGAIVNMSSILGLVGLLTTSAYVAAKHGVIGLTKVAAIEYADRGIRVNAVCPGFTQTTMMDDTMKRRGLELMQTVPAHRLAKPEEIAETVTFLCSDRASFTTGAAHVIDGGYTAK